MAKGAGSRLEQALRLLGADPATADALTRADALWLARVLPQGDASASAGAQASTGPASASTDAVAAQPEAGPAAAVRAQTDAAKAGSDTTALFVQQPGDGDEPQLHARRVPVPAADALPGRAAFERALRPFLRRRPSRVRRMVDAEATAEASAQASADALLAAGPWQSTPALVPVLRPVPERWFDMVLLAEQDDTMRVFDDTLRELRQLLARHGAFRRVGLWRWSVRDGKVHVQTASGMPCAPRAMLQGQHPQLVWVLTHGASTKWDSPELREFVRSLAARAVVAVVQLLPETAWDATALGESRERVRSRERAATNRQLLKRDLWTASWAREGALGVVPMLSLQADSVARWAEFVMAPRALEHAAVAMEALAAQARRPGATPPAAAAADAQAAIREQVLRFRAVASPQAFALLRLLSGAWITLPVMRLLLQSLPGPRALTPMAEVLLSGLLRRTSRPDARTEELTFDFAPGVREWLSGSLSGDERRALDAAMAESKEAIRQFVETKLNRTMTSFSALLLDPEGAELLPASARSFVEVSRQLKALRGGAAVASAPAVTVPAPVPQPQPRAVKRLRILHLSDLHIGRERPISAWRERRLLGLAWRENLSTIQAEGSIDLVCMTGDVAAHGRAEEYAEATHFVRELMDCLQLPMERFFCVPGNHDIDRRLNVDAWEALRRSSAQSLSAGQHQRILDRQAAYHHWIAELGCLGHGDQRGYQAWVNLDLGVPLCVIGLDSAWTCGDDSDEGRIRLSGRELDRLLHGLHEPSLSIVLMHHPLSALADGEAAEHSLAVNGVTLLLHGHRHHPRQARWSATDHGVQVSSPGGLYAPDSMPTSVNVLEVEVHPASADSPPRVGPTRFSSRVWSASGHWREGDGVDLEADAAVEPQATVTQQVSPPSRQAEQGPVFVGRSRELALMCQALLPPSVENERPVFIGGPAGVGKTRLVQEFLEQFWRPGISALLGAKAASDQVMRLTLGPRAYQPSGIDELVDELVDQVFAQLGMAAPAGQRRPRLRAVLRQSPWVVVIEDVDTAEHVVVAQSLAADLPGAAVVATGRAPVLTSSWMQIHLAPLSVAEACELLMAEGVRRNGPPLTQTVTEELAHIAGYLPWALHLALLRWNEGATAEQIRGEFNEKHADATPAITPPAAEPTRFKLELSAEVLAKLDALAKSMESSRPNPKARSIYISAVGSEFSGYREALQRLLQQGRMRAVTSEEFLSTGASPLLQLDDRLLASDVVVHLVGDACGADPRPEDVRALMARYPDLASRTPMLSAVLAGDAPALSFTQWEAWLAHYHGLPQLVAQALPAAPRNAMPAPDASQLERQRRHLGMLERVRPVVSFSGPQDLFAQVLQFLAPAAPASPAERSEVPPLRVFLSHAAGDAAIARRLRDRLLRDGFAPWFAEYDLLPGQAWQAETTRALLDADVVLICLSSRSLDTGFAQQEMRLAVENAARQPEGSVYLIPVRLEPCDVPRELAQWHWVDYFADDGYQRLLRGLAAKRPRPQSPSPAADATPATATALPASGRPSIFLSYARENLKVVRKLVQRLERLGFECLWFDVFEAHGTDDATVRIEAAMQASDYFMPVLSTTADQRPHGRYWEEWRWAIERAQQREGFLLPVGIDKRPPDRMDYKRIFTGPTAELAKGSLLHAREGDLDDASVGELTQLLARRGIQAPKPVPRIFISYAHEDMRKAQKVSEQLTGVLGRHGAEIYFETDWSSTGNDWRPKLEAALDQSDVYLLLLSRRYVATDFYLHHEARRALERMRTHGAKVHMILLSDCDWRRQRPDPHPKAPSLGEIQATGPFDADGRLVPMTDVRNEDAAWVQIVQRIIETGPWEGA